MTRYLVVNGTLLDLYLVGRNSVADFNNTSCTEHAKFVFQAERVPTLRCFLEFANQSYALTDAMPLACGSRDIALSDKAMAAKKLLQVA